MDKKTEKMIKKETRKIKGKIAKHKRLGFKIYFYLFLLRIILFMDFLIGYPFVLLSCFLMIYLVGGGYKEDYFSLLNFPGYFVSFMRAGSIPIFLVIVGLLIFLSYWTRSQIFYPIEKYIYEEKALRFNLTQYDIDDEIKERISRIRELEQTGKNKDTN